MSFNYQTSNLFKGGLPFIISAPAGTGKTTLVNRLIQEFPQIKRSISYTTREKRPQEIDGVDYHFVDLETFETMLQNGDFIEYAYHFNHYYGTSKSALLADLEQGYHVMLVIDVEGALLIKNQLKVISIFLQPPSYEELKQRLSIRSTESDTAIEERLSKAKHELAASNLYDYQIINNDLELAYTALKSIIIAEEHKTLNLKIGG